MKRRKVLYIANTAKGGSAFSLYYLTKGLERYEPIILFYKVHKEHSYIVNKLAQAGIKVITLKEKNEDLSHDLTTPARRRDVGGWLQSRFGQRAGQTYSFLRTLCKLARQETPRVWPIVRAIREHEIDLVHINTSLRTAGAGIIAARLTGRPCVCHIRVLRKLDHFENFFSRFADAFIHISSAVAENYTNQGIPSHKGVVIHNAVDLDVFTTNHDTAPVRSEFGWTDRERLVGIFSRLDWWKGHEYFLPAMAQVSHQIPNLKVLIVGEPQNTPRNQEYFQMLQSLTQSLGLEDKVVFTGFRSDVPRLMAATDVIVLSSSRPEPFGRVVIEGMAASKPVVATAAGGVLDIIEGGINGLLVPCKDSKAIAEAVLELLLDEEKARRIGLAARWRVEKKFTVQYHVAAVQQVYDSLLGAGTERQADEFDGHQVVF